MTFTSQFKKRKVLLGLKLERAGLILEQEMHKTVAIDTGRLDRSIKTGQVQDRGNILSVEVGSVGVPYARGVEYGFGRVVNWHRREGGARPIVWVGDGMLYLNRSLNAVKGEILKLVRL